MRRDGRLWLQSKDILMRPVRSSAEFSSSTVNTDDIAEIKWGKRTSWYEKVDNWEARANVGRSTNRRECATNLLSIQNFLDLKSRELQRKKEKKLQTRELQSGHCPNPTRTPTVVQSIALNSTSHPRSIPRRLGISDHHQ